MSGSLALWHSSEANAATFEAILADLAPEVPLTHHVRADLLAAAQPELTPRVRRAVAEDILKLVDEGAATVLCTCSTLGPGAESAAELTDMPVLRIDRPMIEAALERGKRIAIAAALSSTLLPTRELLQRVAAARGLHPVVREIVVDGAWPRFAVGDRAGYVRRIADALRATVRDVDAVVLAQASMAGAADLLGDLGVPVLASPRIGAAAAVAAWRKATAAG